MSMIRTGPLRPRVAWLFLAVGALALVPAAVAPPVAAVIAFIAIAVGSTVAVVVGYRWQADDLGPWRSIAAACALFFAGALLRVLVPATSVDPPTYAALLPDSFTLPGYALLVHGLLQMMRRRRGLADTSARLDATVVGLGSGLVAWTFLISPVLYRSEAVTPVLVNVVAAVFPVIDVLLVALIAQLAFSAGAARMPALWLLGSAVASLLAGDLLYALRMTDTTLAPLAVSDGLFLLAYIAIGGAALHPTMRALTEPQVGEVSPLGWLRILGIVTALLTPVALATCFPARGTADVTVRLLLAGALTAAIACRTVRAVNNHARAEAHAQEQATHDALTGLPNRVPLGDHVNAALRGVGSDQEVTVLFMDLDGFKLVNDSWGHGVGDELLVAVAGRLRAAARVQDLVCRVGGDEFIVVLTGPAGPELAQTLAARIVTDFAHPFALTVGRVVVTPSIGIARSTPDADAEKLIRDADTAMYKAKAAGRNGYAFFDSSLREQVQARVELEQALRRALEHGELEVYYQPIIDLGTDELAGFEALLRWNHPERGLVSPEEFIPVAEETGLIVPIGAWVLQQATEQLADWQAELGAARELHMSVNICPRQLRHDELVDQVATALLDTGIGASTLWLEITETAMMEDPNAAAATLQRLRDLGVTLAVDDFGTGYSALGYLKRFPVGIVKVDRSFVAGLGVDVDSEAIVRAVVAMAHAIGLTVVAEGIETPLQQDRLSELGCDMAQGYLYGRPRPASLTLSHHDLLLASAA
jgi:diguanylate cyclase (GGDEF)-like protein